MKKKTKVEKILKFKIYPLKSQIAFAVLVACAAAAPQNTVETVKFVNDIQEGGYNFL